jgi:aryl-alcohol dehydrogenase-like predicted oxidoreductase
MEYRALGATGLSVSVIGLGCSRLGAPGRAKTRADMARLLEHAADRGITFFDSADVYMAGESERLLGQVLASRRDRVVIATKVGFRSMLPEALVVRVHSCFGSAIPRGSAGARLAKKARGLLMRKDFSADYLRTSVDASLTRLRTDRIDLLQLHSPSALAIDRDGALETLERLRHQGKIRFYGLAFATWPQAQSALREGGLSTVQLPISVDVPAGGDQVLTWARQRGIGVIANQPLKQGALLRADVISRTVRNLPQAAIRFVTSLPAISTVLVGTTSIAHLDENVAALTSPPLTEEEIACLRGNR